MSWLEHSSLIIALLLVASPNLLAQDSSQVLPGTRVRVTAPAVDANPLKGTVVAVSPETLTLAVEGLVGETWDPRLEIPVESVTGLELSRGKYSRLGKGALIGGLIGGGLGFGLGVAAAAESGGFYDPGAEAIPMAAALLGVMGAGVGGVIGLLSPGERWEEVPLDRIRIEAGVDVTSDGSVALRMRLRL